MIQTHGPQAITGYWPSLANCLLDYAVHPGRYPLALREPRLLFDHGTEVLALASGRTVVGLPKDEALVVQLRQAARFFVRTAMLRPGADHYTLLGLKPAFEPAQLREHYRMLMRLTHPDYSDGGRAWPADAATRINLANDVLSSVVHRSDYDRTLGNADQQWRKVPKPVPDHPPERRLLVRGLPQLPALRRLAMVGGLISGVLLLALWAVSGWSPVEPFEIGQVAFRSAAPWDSPSHMPGRHDMKDEAPSMKVFVPTPPDSNASEAGELVIPPVDRRVTAPDAGSLNGMMGENRLAVRSEPVRQISHDAPVTYGTSVFPSAIVSARAGATTGAAAGGEAPRTTSLGPAVAAAILPDTGAVSPISDKGLGTAAVGPAYAPSSRESLPIPSARSILGIEDVQPLLGNILAAMQSGRGEQVLQWVERPSRPGEGADGFVLTYNRVVANARAVQVGAVRFTGRPGDDGLLVDGVVLLHLLDENQQQVRQEFVLRAQFASRGGQAVLTRLSAREIAR